MRVEVQRLINKVSRSSCNQLNRFSPFFDLQQQLLLFYFMAINTDNIIKSHVTHRHVTHELDVQEQNINMPATCLICDELLGSSIIYDSRYERETHNFSICFFCSETCKDEYNLKRKIDEMVV